MWFKVTLYYLQLGTLKHSFEYKKAINSGNCDHLQEVIIHQHIQIMPVSGRLTDSLSCNII